ncbi:hypothetical protein [Circovirus-like genome DCCV-8]|uniref:Uncharacterized protein n=1 Tax=Circovirus-like genome DCCV-8 TaxID=1788448 RepID=A0A190WHB8_9VIRU|nr:hypothetical protein [Circovirus-like genome DCCV-8]AMB42974.1 hypothetical protein [Circovirus-like genome DCCV-8]
MECDKRDTGSALSPETLGHLNCPTELHGVSDSQSVENQDISTGKYWCPSPPRKPLPKSKLPSDYKGCMLKPPVPLLPRLTCIKKKLETETPSNSDQEQSTGIMQLTGTELKSWRKQVTSIWSQRTFTFVIIAPLLQLQAIMKSLSELRKMSSFFMAEQVRESLGERGKKPDQVPILKIHAANFGVATALTNMLLSMNLEVVSISPTCCDGWIGIQSALRSKGAADP